MTVVRLDERVHLVRKRRIGAILRESAGEQPMRVVDERVEGDETFPGQRADVLGFHGAGLAQALRPTVVVDQEQGAVRGVRVTQLSPGDRARLRLFAKLGRRAP